MKCPGCTGRRDDDDGERRTAKRVPKSRRASEDARRACAAVGGSMGGTCSACPSASANNCRPAVDTARPASMARRAARQAAGATDAQLCEVIEADLRAVLQAARSPSDHKSIDAISTSSAVEAGCTKLLQISLLLHAEGIESVRLLAHQLTQQGLRYRQEANAVIFPSARGHDCNHTTPAVSQRDRWGATLRQHLTYFPYYLIYEPTSRGPLSKPSDRRVQLEQLLLALGEDGVRELLSNESNSNSNGD